MTTRNRLFIALAAAGGILLAGCGSGNGVSVTKNGAGTGSGTINGVVVQAPVAGSTVTAYKLDAAMTRGAVLGTATTADGTAGGPSAGSFSLTIGPYNGALELVASAGTYIDEATGTLTQMAGYNISAVIAKYASGSTVAATISPVSQLAAAFARYYVAKGTALEAALGDAYTHLNAHFGGVDWRTVVPEDPLSVTNVTPAGRAGLILAALSDEAMQISQSLGGSAGVTITAAMLPQALSQDAADGVLDGRGSSGQISVGPLPSTYKLDGATARFSLATGMQDFVHRKALKSLSPDALTLASAIAANADPYLFQSPGQSLDMTPPPVALVTPGSGAGPYYANTATTTVTATATDLGNGVAAVYARASGDSTRVEGTLANGIWTLANIPLSAGANIVTVWATDTAGAGAAASCVSAGGATPSNCVTTTIVYKNTGPVAQVVAGKSKYCDESTMTVAASVPPVYSFAGGCVPSDVGAGAAIHKAASRITPASTHSAADLENANPDNLPWVPFGISVYGAPLASASYSITTFPGSTTGNSHTYSGDLLPWLSPGSSLATTTGIVYFDLPLDSVRIPELTSNVGATPFVIRVTATDAAGNPAEPCVFTAYSSSGYHVVGPPLAYSEDTTYPSKSETKSTYPYTRGNNNYGVLYDGVETAFSPENAVRLIRYTVTNPGPVPVALAPVAGGWTSNETWTAQYVDTGVKTVYGHVGTCFAPPTTGMDSCRNPTDSCIDGCSWAACFWRPAAGGQQCWGHCVAMPDASLSGTAASAVANPLAYYGQPDQETAATMSAGGRWIVPAATSGGPGVMVVYITRPYAVTRTYPAITRKESPYQEVLGHWLGSPIYNSKGCQSGTTTSETYTYTDFIYLRKLEAAQDVLIGSWQPATYGLSSVGGELGEPSAYPGIPFMYTRTIVK